MKLFAIGNGSVSDYLRSNISSLKDKIASYTDEQIMNSDFDEWVEYLTKKYQVEPITFSLMQLQEVCMKQPFNSTIHGAGWEVPMESLNITTWMAITLTSKFPLLVIRFFLNANRPLIHSQVMKS